MSAPSNPTKTYSNEELTKWKATINACISIGKRISIRREGDEWVGLCPFREEKTPSFKVYKNDEGVWLFKCFGCGETGNVFQFVERCDHVSFTHAIEIVLAEAEGIDPATVEVPTGKKKIVTFTMAQYAQCERALETSPVGQKWITDRGITMDTARHFHLGFVQDATKVCGTDHPWRADGWVTFPTLSDDGKTVYAIKYRSLVAKKQLVGEGDDAKLISGILRAQNTATLLYNLREVNELDDVIVCEGEPDTLVLHQQTGIPAVGLPSGIYKFTETDITALKTAKRIFLAGDNDKEGARVMDRLWKQLGDRTYKIQWPDGIKDANESLLQLGNSKFCITFDRAVIAAVKRGEWQNPTQKATKPESSDYVVFESAANMHAKRILWLWPGRLLQGGINGFSGEPGTGKSSTAIDTLARFTRGDNFPDGAVNPFGCPKSVGIICDEDNAEQVILPRLMAAHADLNRVFIIKKKRRETDGTIEDGEMRLDNDLPLIEQRLQEHKDAKDDVVVIMLDPVTEYLGDTDPNSDQEVRPIYRKLLAVSARTNLAWILISHSNKNQQATAVNRNSGAKVMITIPRANWQFAEDPKSTDGQFLMLQGKSNLAVRKTLAFHLRTTTVETVTEENEPLTIEDVLSVEWNGTTDDKVNDILIRTFDREDSAKTKVRAFFDSILSEGPKLATECYAAAKEKGITVDVLQHNLRSIHHRKIKVNGETHSWWAQTIAELDSLQGMSAGAIAAAVQAPDPNDVLTFLQNIIGSATVPVSAIKATAEARGMNWETVRKTHQRHGYESVPNADKVKCWRKTVTETGPEAGPELEPDLLSKSSTGIAVE